MGVFYGSGGDSDSGRIVQVVNTGFSGSFYTNNTSMTTIGGLTTNFTMHDSGKKVLVMVNMGTAGIGGSNNFAYLRLYRDSSNFVHTGGYGFVPYGAYTTNTGIYCYMAFK